MKKDKNHSPERSSTALILGFSTKEESQRTEKKVCDRETLKVRCPICSKEIAPKRQCFGHGAGTKSGDTDSKKVSKKNEPQRFTLGIIRKRG